MRINVEAQNTTKSPKSRARNVLSVVNTCSRDRNCTLITKLRMKDGGIDKINNLVHLYKVGHKYRTYTNSP